ncbi:MULTISPECIES: helix-turn-helix domain-containing protein [unclassified Streptomyces]|uniref:helix-turn-helix domain-containing protein n=1 Tax=unclassified Streptomyces TaxID=2593676 RepID=UPI0006B0223C|nr:MULTISPECIES: helix-turn-helix transcriptional regulator [unclassified Streptomyces]KOX30857.1 XRE family transcriptional regulator [Streptomyces sp. NRRL F-6491]KOX39727.1 XRE family transcriptional regulator [Streptomyces sp. NRRL F-6492]
MARGKRQDVWEFFGDLLKERREAAGISQSELGGRVFVSGGYIGLFEQGIRKPQLDVAKRIDEVLQTGGIFERTWRKLIDKSPYASYFHAVAELEAVATKICEFAPTVVPGLMQTGAYARAVTLAMHPFAAEEFVDEKVTSRIERAKILADTTRPEYWVILHENAVLTPVGGAAVMAAALEHIVELIRERQVLVTVLPRSVGAHSVMEGSLRLMEFKDQPPTAYTETAFSGTLLDDPAMVKQAQRAYDLLRVATLSPEASLKLIESAAEDFRRCASTT